MQRIKFTKNERIVLEALQEGLEKTKRFLLSKRMFRSFAYDKINDTNKSRAFKRGFDSLLKKGFILEENGKYKIF